MKKAIKITAITIGILVLLFAAYCIWGAFDYVNRVPKIEPLSPVRAEIGSTLQIDDLVKIQCGGDYTTKMRLSDIKNTYDAKVAEDGQSIFVGNDEGRLTVSILAYGSESTGADVEVIVYKAES